MGRHNLPVPERLARRKEQRRRSDMSRIRLGQSHQRWRALKHAYGIKCDTAVAELLLDSFESMQKEKAKTARKVDTGSLSDSSDATCMEVVEEGAPLPRHSKKSKSKNKAGTKGSDKVKAKGPAKWKDEVPPSKQKHFLSDTSDAVRKHLLSNEKTETPSHSINLQYTEDGDVVFMGTMPEDEEFSNEEDLGDQDWGESLQDIAEKLKTCHPEGFRELSAEEIFEAEMPGLDDTPHEDEQAASIKIKEISSDRTFIGYESSLRQILLEIPTGPCTSPGCTAPIEVKMTTVGTALTARWVCQNGHSTKTWSSQPKVHEDFVGNIGLSAATVLTGNDYTKVRLLCRCLNMGTCGQTLHDDVEKNCTFPAVSLYWQNMQRSLLDERKGDDVVIAAAGMSQGNKKSSPFCTYATMDYETSDILNLSTLNKTDVQLVQEDPEYVEMEAFIETMGLLKQNQVKVAEVVTDAHYAITDYIREDPSIQHSYDTWQTAKDVAMRVAEASRRSDLYHLLQSWVLDVAKHFWWCSKHAEGDSEKLLASWRGILPHAAGFHQWILGDGGGPAGCEHGPLPDDFENKILKSDSLPHIALGDIILDRQLLDSLDFYTQCRHMGALENFWSYVSAYAPDKFTYSSWSYKTRNILAAIDYQTHKNRQQKTEDGQPLFRRHFDSTTGRWVRVPILEKKQYPYIPHLMQGVFTKRLVKSESG